MSKRMRKTSSTSRWRALLALVGAAFTLRWRRYLIAEASMEPTLVDGDWVIGIRRPRRVIPGDVVACAHPRRADLTIAKRVASVDPADGSLWLEADNVSEPAATDSSTFGRVPAELLEARLVLRYRPRPFVVLG